LAKNSRLCSWGAAKVSAPLTEFTIEGLDAFAPDVVLVAPPVAAELSCASLLALLLLTVFAALLLLQVLVLVVPLV